MTERVYLEKLAHELKMNSVTYGSADLTTSEVEEILSDTREHFESGRARGKSIDEIIRGLGSPETLASGYRAQSSMRVPPASDVSLSKRSLILFRAMKVLFILAPMNFFLAIGPFIFIAGLVFAGWVAAGVFGFAGFLTMSEGVSALGGSLANSVALAILFFGLGVTGVGLIAGFIMVALSEAAFRLIWIWFRWNFRILMSA